MDALIEYAALNRRGVALLEDIHAVTINDLIALGFPSTEARSMKNLAATYLGPSRTPRQQADAVTLARANEHSLAILSMIRRIARKSLGEEQGFTLIKEFCALTGTYAEIEHAATERVEAINREVEDRKKKAYGRRSAVTSKRATPDGLKTLQVSGPADDIDRIANSIKDGVRRRMKDNRKLLRSQATYDELLHQYFGQSQAPEKVYQPVVAIGLSDACRILDGEGDDVHIAASDGQILTGAELINARLTDETYFALVHPVEGPINLYRSSRFANHKQRTMAKAENPICPAPGCYTPADDCEIHHLDAWAQGGDTNMSRLTGLCPRDNGLNDDHPDNPRHGRMDRVNGKIHFVPADGGQPRRNTHTAASMGLMDLI